MEKIIANYFEGLKIGRQQSFKNLAIYPLLSDYAVTFDYLTLDQALGQNTIEIHEISKDGSVPELKVVNKASTMVLILDGEELVGAKQNRIVNTTILVPAEAEIVIPVSCVEQGRWSDDSSVFSSKERIMSSNMRAMKSQQVSDSVRDRGSFRSEQGAIWDEVSKKAHRRGAVSPSMAMSEIYEKEKPAINQYIKEFKNIDSQVGAAFMINGEIAGMDCFGKPETFSAVFKKLIGSYALDAIDFFEEGQEHKVLKSKLTSFIKNSVKAPVHAQKSVGEGMDCRLETKKITGFALCHEEQIPHMSIFTKTDIDKQGARMQSFSRRKRHRL
jgi:hypothetical protein